MKGSRDPDPGLAEEFGAGDIHPWAQVSRGAGDVPGKDLKEGLLEGMVGESMRHWGPGGVRGPTDPHTRVHSPSCTWHARVHTHACTPPHGPLHMRAQMKDRTGTWAHTSSSLTPTQCNTRQQLMRPCLHSLTPQVISRGDVGGEEAACAAKEGSHQPLRSQVAEVKRGERVLIPLPSQDSDKDRARSWL